jgi:hypothetical protein
MTLHDLSWREWKRFETFKDLPNPATGLGCGVYQIRAAFENGQPVTIHRAIGSDPDGILYIGEGNLEGRVGLLLNIYRDDAKPHHHFIDTFRHYGFDRIADRQHLQIRWAECDQCARIENELIEVYRKKYGDNPPGNIRLGGGKSDKAVIVTDSETDKPQLK